MYSKMHTCFFFVLQWLVSVLMPSSSKMTISPGAISLINFAPTELMAQLSEATTSSFVYHNVSLIIYEEVPAYFEGQKSFDDVCAAINNRAQTVLDERK